MCIYMYTLQTEHGWPSKHYHLMKVHRESTAKRPISLTQLTDLTQSSMENDAAHLDQTSQG